MKKESKKVAALLQQSPAPADITRREDVAALGADAAAEVTQAVTTQPLRPYQKKDPLEAAASRSTTEHNLLDVSASIMDYGGWIFSEALSPRR